MSLVEWVHATETATAIRESQIIYPVLQCIHILGIGLFAGGVVMVNLRVIGFGQAIGLAAFSRHAMRVAWLGLAMIAATGLFMAASFIDVFWVSTVMHIKLIAILFALMNAVAIQKLVVSPAVRNPALVIEPNARARQLAALGIVVLLTIITLGKLLAYIGGKD